MKYDVKKIIKKVILVSSLTILVLILILSFNDLNAIIKEVQHVNLKYLGYGVLALAVYATLLPLSLSILAINKIKIRHTDLFLIGTSEFFFNGITPLATGGQPFQVYMLNECKVKPSKATGLLLVNFLLTQFVITCFSLVSFIVFYHEVINNMNNLLVLIIIGFLANFIILLIFSGVCYLKFFQRQIVNILKLFCKIKIINKKLGHKVDDFENYCIASQEASKEFIENKIKILLSLVLKVLAQTAFYAIPYFVLLSLGVDLKTSDFMFIIAMTSFALTMSVWVPTPGGSGGIELAFKSLFTTLPNITGTVVAAGMLIWRLLTYYILIIYSLTHYLFIERRKKHYQNESDE